MSENDNIDADEPLDTKNAPTQDEENEVPAQTAPTQDEENEVPAQTTPKHKADRVVLLVYTSLLLAFQVLLLTFLLCGCVQFNGRGISVIYAFNLIMNIFTVTYATVYKSIVGGIFAVVFAVFVVFIIIRIVRSVRVLITAVKRKEIDAASRRLNLVMTSAMFDNYMNSFVNVIVFAVVSNLFGVSEFTGMTITLMVFGGLAFSVQVFLNYFYYGRPIANSDFILDTVMHVVQYIAMALIVVFLNKTAAKDFLYGAQKMFNGNVFSDGFASTVYSLYVNIIEPVFFVLIAIMMLLIIVNRLRNPLEVDRNQRKRVTLVLVLVAITTGLYLIFRVIVAGGRSFDISMIGDWLILISSSYIPLLLLSVILLLISKMRSATFVGAIKKGSPAPQS